ASKKPAPDRQRREKKLPAATRPHSRTPVRVYKEFGCAKVLRPVQEGASGDWSREPVVAAADRLRRPAREDDLGGAAVGDLDVEGQFVALDPPGGADLAVRGEQRALGPGQTAAGLRRDPDAAVARFGRVDAGDHLVQPVGDRAE